jgi:hypothetical protein
MRQSRQGAVGRVARLHRSGSERALREEGPQGGAANPAGGEPEQLPPRHVQVELTLNRHRTLWPSLLRNRFVEIEDHAGHCRPGGVQRRLQA